MYDLDEQPTPPTLTPAQFEQLHQDLKTVGPVMAVERLCSNLLELGDYNALFYAMLMKKRVELGVSPFPTGSAADLPKEVHEPYEEAIRSAGRLVGNLFLKQGDFPRAWFYFRMLDEPAPVYEAIDQYQFDPDQDPQPVIEVALYQGVHPKKGFDLVLERYGICNAITTFGSQDWSKHPQAKEHAIGQMVRHLHEQLVDRIQTDLINRGETIPQFASIPDMIRGKDYLFGEHSYHVDTSHLSSVCQYALELSPGPEMKLARGLCAYGEKLNPAFHFHADPPFENTYKDYRILLEVLDGVQVEAGLNHFRNKVETGLAEGYTFPAEVLVNLYLRLHRPADALAVAKKYLTDVQRPMSCPSVYELCVQEKDYLGLAEAARQRHDGIHFLAGFIAAEKQTR